MSTAERSALVKAHNETFPYNAILKKMPAFELEYKGFDREWYKDRFDPNLWGGHYTENGTDHIDDFTYEVEAEEMFEFVRDLVDESITKGTAPKSELIDELAKRFPPKQYTSTEEEQADNDAYDLFIAKHLEEFVELFMDDVLEHFQDEAYQWAEEHLEPADDDDYWDDWDD